mgnify:FL=1|jgi:hypothetical protein
MIKWYIAEMLFEDGTTWKGEVYTNRIVETLEEIAAFRGQQVKEMKYDETGRVQTS